MLFMTSQYYYTFAFWLKANDQNDFWDVIGRIEEETCGALISMQTVSFLSWSNGWVYRGGVGTSAYSPGRFAEFTGSNCEEVCGKVWDRHSPTGNEPLKYAHCTSESFGNGELVATSNQYIDTMVTNVALNRASFIIACARMWRFSLRGPIF